MQSYDINVQEDIHKLKQYFAVSQFFLHFKTLTVDHYGSVCTRKLITS